MTLSKPWLTLIKVTVRTLNQTILNFEVITDPPPLFHEEFCRPILWWRTVSHASNKRGLHSDDWGVALWQAVYIHYLWINSWNCTKYHKFGKPCISINGKYMFAWDMIKWCRKCIQGLFLYSILQNVVKNASWRNS